MEFHRRILGEDRIQRRSDCLPVGLGNFPGDPHQHIVLHFRRWFRLWWYRGEQEFAQIAGIEAGQRVSLIIPVPFMYLNCIMV